VSPDCEIRCRSWSTSPGWFCSSCLAWSGEGSCWPGRGAAGTWARARAEGSSRSRPRRSAVRRERRAKIAEMGMEVRSCVV